MGFYLFASGSYEIFNFPVDARNLALHNSSSAYDGVLLNNNPSYADDELCNAKLRASTGKLKISYDPEAKR
jgi:hypothetical protein